LRTTSQEWIVGRRAPQALRSLEKRESEELLLKISRETVDKPPKV
jgi:hypothetical protein